MKEYLKKISLVLATCTFLFSCDKFLEENPKDKLPEDDVYNSCLLYTSPSPRD